MRTDLKREALEHALADIDRRRAELEMVLASLPLDSQHCCGDYQRQAVESELQDLWELRIRLAGQSRGGMQG
jgi:hypothetical protein